MKRKYTNTTEETTANFFYGIEVEHTPAFGMETLFVTGVHQPSDILYYTTNNLNVKHIYCGANQSYHPNTPDELKEWEDMIYALLKQDFWVTLDFDVSHAEDILESGLNENRKFISMISIKLPYIDQFNYNTTIKIDDKGFEATNAGVWCHRLRDLQGTDKFTGWDAYKNDKIIK